jgi:hypothetical protein
VIDSRDFIAAKRHSETEVLMPPGPKIAFTGGIDCNDHHTIWQALDRVQAPDLSGSCTPSATNHPIVNLGGFRQPPQRMETGVLKKSGAEENHPIIIMVHINSELG